MDTIALRLAHYLEQKNGGNQSELARFCGVSPQAVQKWIAGVSEPRGKNLENAAKFLGISQISLRFGDDGKSASASDIYQEPRTKSNIASASIGVRRIPLVSYVQAGNMRDAVLPYSVGDADEWLLTDLDLSANSFALEIKGDSMLPDFKEGDRVIIDAAIQPHPGDFVVAKNGHEEATFKRYRHRGVNEKGEEIIELVPLNPDFPSMQSDKSPFVIIGTMVEHRRYRKK